MRKYALDTHLYVRAFRERAAAEALERFYVSFAPVAYLSSVVLHELLAGAATAAKMKQIHEHMARPFGRSGRIVTPSHGAWEASGAALARLAREEGLEVRRVPKSFVHDLILAASCREAGVTLITENTRDFARIARVIPLRFVAPWPTAGRGRG